LDIAVVGSGFVGQATGRGFARFGHNVHFYDLDKNKVEKLLEEGYSASFHKTNGITSHDIIFICVPETCLEFDLWNKWYKAKVWVIRSTVPPGTTAKLHYHTNEHFMPWWLKNQANPDTSICVCHNPEFLRQAFADYEFMNPDKIVIGECCKKSGDILEELYKPFHIPIVRVDPTTSELIKLASNAYLSTQISFWNQIKLIADKLGVNSHIIGKACSLDPRISDYGASMHGSAFGGYCLPKDLAQLKTLAMQQGVTSLFLDAVKEINDWMKVKK